MLRKLGELLCSHGLHNWDTFETAFSAFRRCKRKDCPEKQFYFQGRGWSRPLPRCEDED